MVMSPEIKRFMEKSVKVISTLVFVVSSFTGSAFGLGCSVGTAWAPPLTCSFSFKFSCLCRIHRTKIKWRKELQDSLSDIVREQASDGKTPQFQHSRKYCGPLLYFYSLLTLILLTDLQWAMQFLLLVVPMSKLKYEFMIINLNVNWITSAVPNHGYGTGGPPPFFS